MTVTLGQMDWRLGVNSADFQRGLANAEDQARGFGSKITGVLATGAKVAFGAAVVGVGALGAVLAQSTKEASSAEEITAQLNAVIKSTGGIAGVSAQAIQDHALALSQVTRFEDDAIVEADAMLLTFTKIGKDVFPQATDAILDVATAFKMDLTSAAKMVGKALNDPEKGLTALSKAGVQFSEDQKAMIKNMVEAGDMAGAQALILKELEIQTGRSARAAGETMAGQMDILKNALGNVKEEIGGALIPISKDFVTWIGPKLTAGLQKFSDWFRKSMVDVKQFAGQLGKAKDMIGGMINDWKTGDKIEWQDLMNLAGLFTNSVDIQRKFAEIATTISDVLVVVGELGDAIKWIVEGKAWNIDWWGDITDAIFGMGDTSDKVADKLYDMGVAVGDAIATIKAEWDKAKTAFSSTDGSLFIKIKAVVETVDWKALWNGIKTAAKSVFSVASTIAAEIWLDIKATWDAIDWEQVKTDLLAAANTALTGIGLAIDAIVLTVKNIDWAQIQSQLWLIGQTIKTELGWILADVGAWIQTQAPIVAASINAMLKQAITINGQMIGEDATLAYSLGAGLMKLIMAAVDATMDILMIGPKVGVWLVDQIVGFISNDTAGQGNIATSIGDFLSGAFDAMMTQIAPDWLIKLSTWWDGIWLQWQTEGVSTAMGSIATAIETEVGKWATAIENKVGQFVAAGGNLIKGVAKGITDWAGSAATAIEDAAKSVITAIKNVFGIASPSTVMAGIGADIVNGLKQGIVDAARDFATWIVEWARGIIPKPLWKFFGIESPSKLMIEMGRNIGGGLALGVLQSADSVNAAMGTIMGQISGASVPSLSFAPSMASGASGGSYGRNGNDLRSTMDMPPITVNVYAAGGGADVVQQAAVRGVEEVLYALGYR